MAQANKPSAPDLDSSNMDLESSNSSGGNNIAPMAQHPDDNNLNINVQCPSTNDAVNISTDFLLQHAHSKYPQIRKPPPPPPRKEKLNSNAFKIKHGYRLNDDNKNESDEKKQDILQHNKRSGLSSSALNLFSSAKSSISKGAKSVSSATSERISLDGQLKQARISLERFVNPKIINKEINADKVIPKWVLKGAKGIVFLTVVKAGFLLAGSIGTGVVIVRRKDGLWSGPSSIGVAGIAAGFLLGASKVDYIMILPNNNAVTQFTGKGQLRLGGELELAVGPLGRDASGSVGAGDKGFSVIYSYSHSAGLYGGLGLDGKIISVRPKCNEEFYGEKMSVSDILLGDLDPQSIENEDYELITHLLDAYCIDDDEKKKEKKDDKSDGNIKETAVFGRNVNELESSKLNGYKSEIPNILITLKDALYKYEGHLIEGIFRIAPQKSKLKAVQNIIDDGNLYDVNFEDVDCQIIAALIKMWFREMPSMIFDDLEYESIENVESISDAHNLLDIMKEPELSYFYWILDLCIEIGKYSDINLMNNNNMAVVISPNLYNMVNVKSMTISSSMVQFVGLCIELRVEMKHLNDANKIMDQVFDEENGNENNEQIDTPSKPEIPL